MARPRKEEDTGFNDLALKQTRWKNNLTTEQTLKLLVPDGRNIGYRTIIVTFKPGEEKLLPSEYDNLIHQVKGGQIVGGLAPRLTKIGSEETLHDALNVEFQQKKHQRELMMKKKLEAMALDEELKELTSNSK